MATTTPYTSIAANFDGNDLTSVAGVSILATNPYRPPKRTNSLYPLARRNKAKLNSAFYTEKQLTIRCNITRDTRELAETSYESLMILLQGLEKTLLIKETGGNRSYTATYADTVFRVEGGSYLEFDLVFDTSDHFGYDVAQTLLLQVSGFTSAQKTDQITIGGSADWQAPIITITWSVLTGGTTKAVVVGNDNTGQQVTVTRTWAAGDVLEIDALNGTVKVNGVEVSYTGAIPEWAPGVGYISYSDNFTTRTFSNTMRYYKRFI